MKFGAQIKQLPPLIQRTDSQLDRILKSMHLIPPLHRQRPLHLQELILAHPGPRIVPLPLLPRSTRSIARSKIE